MKYLGLLLALTFLSSCHQNTKKGEQDVSVNSSDSLTDKEVDYLKKRDAYIEQFKPFEKSWNNDSVSKVHTKALLDLEVKIKEVLKGSLFSGKGKNNLQTLIPSLGFGMLDGLWFIKDSLRVFYTTKNLFVNHFNISELTPEVVGGTYQNAFFDNAYVETLYSFKINSNKNIQAFGTVALVTQMNSPFPPNHLFVFVLKDKFVYMLAKELNEKIYELPKCKMIGDSINSVARKYGERYRASNLQDTAAINEEFRLEKVAYKKYCECYQNEIASDPLMKTIQKQMEAMVKYLEP